ncbi:caffeoylshikimate esterase-like [Dorcoceras hygrometricum]|uniref:Caffeoylshikimate esterase-like n=1 Tax=Dorcoceras hygrometricum TaxID=472368 RepID=A0A2Z7BCB2_9LAMI|nr:caffeoylshikimate esterase-like [Dorcoceras hygrometricum]
MVLAFGLRVVKPVPVVHQDLWLYKNGSSWCPKDDSIVHMFSPTLRWLCKLVMDPSNDKGNVGSCA